MIALQVICFSLAGLVLAMMVYMALDLIEIRLGTKTAVAISLIAMLFCITGLVI